MQLKLGSLHCCADAKLLHTRDRYRYFDVSVPAMWTKTSPAVIKLIRYGILEEFKTNPAKHKNLSAGLFIIFSV